MNEKPEDFPAMVAGEVAKARSKHPPIKSLHEGYAVIKEEEEEFWEWVKMKAENRDRYRSKMVAELVQIGAMAERVAEDVLGVPKAQEPKPAQNLSVPEINPMETAPLDGTYVLLFGPSGYMGTPLRCEVCRFDPEYRPRNPWQTYSHNGFSDSGEPPVGWLPLPKGGAV